MTKVTELVTLLSQAQKGEQVDPLELVEIPRVKEQFIKAFKRFQDGDGELNFEAEKMNFLHVVSNNSDLKKCTPLTLFKAFINIAANGLSFSPAVSHAYLIPRFNKDSQKYLCDFELSPYGYAQTLVNNGIIDGYDKPKIVYDCDEYEEYEKDGKFSLYHKPAFKRPQKSEMIRTYLKFWSGEKVFYSTFAIEDLLELKQKSKQKFGAWQSSEKGMLRAKTVKHGLKNFIYKTNKNILPFGDVIEMNDERIEQVYEQHQEQNDVYGFDDEETETIEI